jgi:hypothetical protein
MNKPKTMLRKRRMIIFLIDENYLSKKYIIVNKDVLICFLSLL